MGKFSGLQQKLHSHSVWKTPFRKYDDVEKAMLSIHTLVWSGVAYYYIRLIRDYVYRSHIHFYITVTVAPAIYVAF